MDIYRLVYPWYLMEASATLRLIPQPLTSTAEGLVLKTNFNRFPVECLIFVIYIIKVCLTVRREQNICYLLNYLAFDII